MTNVGQPLPRVDGSAKVTGAAHYAIEFDQPNQAYGVLVTATIGLGRTAAIDTAEAERLPGVIAIIDHRNAPRLPYAEHRAYIDPQVGERLHVVQDDRVRFFGHPIAIVVAETLDAAEHAAARVRVRYEAERPELHIDAPSVEAVVPGAARSAGGDLSADTARGDADAALARAPVTIDARYGIAREHHNPMEPHATIAAWDGDRLTLWSKSQWVGGERGEIAAIFGVPVEHVLVICPYIGGAFGSCLRTWPHVTMAAIAAQHVGRPVKLALTRQQMFFATGCRPRTIQRLAIGATTEGRLSAIIHEATAETSRYEEFIEGVTGRTRMLYSCPNVRTRYRLAPLDISTPTYMRGPGESIGIVALECAMDELAVALGIDPIELRLRNEPTVDEYTGLPFSSRSLTECYRVGAAKFGWARRTPTPRSMRDGRLLIGWGVASGTYPARRRTASARCRVNADGTADVEAAASDMGPGTYTSMTQVAADALGLPMSAVRFRLGRSDFPPTPAHGGSVTMASVGPAVQAACLAAREQPGTFAEATSTRGEEGNRYSFHSFSAVFVEVAVDPDLGIVRVRRIVGAYGNGRIVNPRLAHSQCIGGMVGGIGMALMEQTVLDPRDGRPVNGSMADYLVPVNPDIASLEAYFVDEADPYVNPLGAKGLGEISYIGVAPAIANAVYHATGRRVRHLPIRIEDLL